MFSIKDFQQFYLAKKSESQQDEPDSGACSVVPKYDWTSLFIKFYISFQDKKRHDEDDMIYFVTASMPKMVNTFRYNSPKIPSFNDTNIDWEETTCLNILFHEFKFLLFAFIKKANGDLIKSKIIDVYPSIISHNVENKKEILDTFPYIGFHLYTFEEEFESFIVSESSKFAFEMISSHVDSHLEDSSIICSQIDYDNLKIAYDSNKVSFLDIIPFKAKKNKLLNIDFYIPNDSDGKVKLRLKELESPEGQNKVEKPDLKLMMTSIYFSWELVFNRIFKNHEPPNLKLFSKPKTETQE
ncbi:hypothetical protein RF11_07286 [Thelohanellus kitauei]|uniref:Uncharacterized protein n=1 Tax=Thelohanellus kitauei TaxID=669202 RepID=A0A0C2IWH6_THEKT|nr:hypothetical protein RF11_07286 [Thelohanellus kitauei]